MSKVLLLSLTALLLHGALHTRRDKRQERSHSTGPPTSNPGFKCKNLEEKTMELCNKYVSVLNVFGYEL
jgi:hypothetical protein